jgi:hypothetical protein
MGNMRSHLEVVTKQDISQEKSVELYCQEAKSFKEKSAKVRKREM